MIKYLKAQFNRFKLPMKVDKVLMIHGIPHYQVIQDELKIFYILNENNEPIIHREDDQPAVVVIDNEKYNHEYSLLYYKNGKLHKDNDEPAVYIKNNSDEKKLVKFFNIKDYIPEKFISNFCSARGFRAYFINGVLHREKDLPAIKSETLVFKLWVKNGKIHREKKEALEYCTSPYSIMLARQIVHIRKKRNGQPSLNPYRDPVNFEKFYYYEGQNLTKEQFLMKEKLIIF